MPQSFSVCRCQKINIIGEILVENFFIKEGVNGNLVGDHGLLKLNIPSIRK